MITPETEEALMTDKGQGSIFLDSGAFSLRKVAKESGDPRFFDSPTFWDYVDKYGEFVQKNPHIEYYANIDVLRNPAKSYKVLRYLENKWNIKPIPVIHCFDDLMWLEKYIADGYPLIGFGGLVRSNKVGRKRWLASAFEIVCPRNNDRMPVIKTHGFGVCTHHEIISYPWFSVDSTAWIMAAAFGHLYAPRKSPTGDWDFAKPPYKIMISSRSPQALKEGRHWSTFSKAERETIREWLDFVEIPLGKCNTKGEMLRWGVKSHPKARSIVNLYYFQMLADSLPQYPCPFKTRGIVKGFDLL